MSTKLYTPRTWVDTPPASRDPMSEFNVNRELHDMVDFLQNPPYAHVVGAGTSLATAVAAVVQWATPPWEDADSMFQVGGSTSRLTCQLAGVYEVKTVCLWASNAVGRRQTAIYKNGGTVCWRSQIANATGGAATEVFVRADVRLALGDYVEVYGFQDSGGNLTANTNFGGDSYFQARWVRR